MMRTLTIKLPSKNKLLVYCQFILVMIMFWLRDVLHFSINYYIFNRCYINLYYIYEFPRIRAQIRQAECKYQLRIVGLIVLCMMLGAIFNFVSPLLTLWGVRNNLRFRIFFCMCRTV